MTELDRDLIAGWIARAAQHGIDLLIGDFTKIDGDIWLDGMDPDEWIDAMTDD